MRFVLFFFIIWLVFGSKNHLLLKSGKKLDLDEYSLRRSLDEVHTFIIKIPDSNLINSLEKICKHTLGYYLGDYSYTIRSTYTNIQNFCAKNPKAQIVGQYKPEHKHVKTFSHSELSHFENFEKRKKNSDNALDEHLIFSILLEKSKPIISDDQTHTESSRRTFYNIKEKISHSISKYFDSNIRRHASLPSYKVLQVSNEKVIFRITILEKKIRGFLSIEERKIINNILFDIASIGGVHFIEKVSIPKTSNMNMKEIIKEFDSKKGKLKINLKGNGQVIGIGDSGLDYYSCYFLDDTNEIKFHKNPGEDVVGGLSSHRKVLLYWDYIDRFWEGKQGSHGTHVSGTTSGNYYKKSSKLSDYNGIAEESKIFFTDIGCTTEGGCSCDGVIGCACDVYDDKKCPSSPRYVFPPEDLNANFFPFPYKHGVRIHTNSWGGESSGYSSSSKEIDQFVWEHSDFVVLFAAGNAGDNYGFSSLDNQAECKNCITVGCSRNSLKSYETIGNEIRNIDVYRQRYIQSVRMNNFCDNLDCSNVPVTNETEILCNNVNITHFDCCKEDEYCAHPLNNSCGCGIYDDTYGYAGDTCCKKCFAHKYQRYDNEFHLNESLAYFSSLGPTQTDGRIKPDIVAPGYYLLSAGSTSPEEEMSSIIDKCMNDEALKSHLCAKAGTSMATPSAAGAVALIREYLMSDFFDIPEKSPSASLVKGMLIHSADKMDGDVYLQGDYRHMYDDEYRFNDRFLQGFGRINLQNIVGNEKLTYLEVESIKTKENHFVCYKRVKENEDYADERVKVTLVWTDPPSVPSKRIHLVNDINLILTYKKIGKTGFVDRDFIFGNSDTKNVIRRDYVNNVEQIDFVIKGSDFVERFVLIVEGFNIPFHRIHPQSYSLIITPTNFVKDHCTEMEKDVHSVLGIDVRDIYHISGAVNQTVLYILNVLLIFSLVISIIINIVFLLIVMKNWKQFGINKTTTKVRKLFKKNTHSKLGDDELEEENDEEKIEEVIKVDKELLNVDTKTALQDL